MAVLVLDLPVLAVNVEFGALVLADLAPGIDGILLLEVAAASGRFVFRGKDTNPSPRRMIPERRVCLLLMVEVAGIEPASENHPHQASTCLVRVLS